MPRELIDMTEPELRDLMKALAIRITTECYDRDIERPHFCLLVFNDPAVAQYIGNCERRDIIKAMRECADRLERREDVTR